MTHVPACCCDTTNDSDIIYFVPCPDYASTAPTFKETRVNWEIILNVNDLTIGKVYRITHSGLTWCGKLSLTGTATEFTPSSGYQEVDDCDDSDCPVPPLYFVPCDTAPCDAYPLKADWTFWRDKLGITGLNHTDPTTYEGTWKFTRDFGGNVCDDEEVCHEWCGYLASDAEGSVCFDSNTLTPACKECDVDENQIQVIGCSDCLSTSAITFVSISSSKDCDNRDCPANCVGQKCLNPSDQPAQLKYVGRKFMVFDVSNEVTTNGENCYEDSGGYDFKVNQSGKYKIKFNLTIDYTAYLKGENRASSPPTIPPIVYNAHEKDRCIVIDKVTLSAVTFEYDNDSTSKRYQSVAGGGNCGEGSLVDTTVDAAEIENAEITLFGPQNNVVSNVQIEKRLGLFDEAAQCSGTASPNERVCSPDIPDEACLLNVLSCGEFKLRFSGTMKHEYSITNSSGVETDSGNNESAFSQDITFKLTTAQFQSDASDSCECTDLPNINVLYWTDYPDITTFLSQTNSWVGIDQSLAASLLADLDSVPDGSGGTTQMFPSGGSAYGSQNSSTKGPWLDPVAQKMHLDSSGRRGYACNNIGTETAGWEFEANLTGIFQPTTNQFEKTLSWNMSIYDTPISLECISSSDHPGQGSACGDGMFDI